MGVQESIIQFLESVWGHFSGHQSVFMRSVSTIVVLIATYVILRVLSSSLKRFTSGMFERHYRRTVYRIFQIILSVVALFIVLGIWGVSMTGLLAGAGFMGIVVGLAAQETLGNVISGLLMMFSRPFELGDWIELNDYSGVVTDITVINTRLETFDGELVSVPNQMVSSSAINNISRRGQLRVKKTVGIDYEADFEKAKEIAEEIMNDHEIVAKYPSPKAMIDGLGDSSVNITFLFWIDNPTPSKRRETVNDLIATVKKEFEENDIGIPFPHMELIQHEGKSWSLEKEED